MWWLIGSTAVVALLVWLLDLRQRRHPGTIDLERVRFWAGNGEANANDV